MPQQKNMVVGGIPAGGATAIQGRVAGGGGNGLSAAGSTQATAASLPGDINYITTVASGAGVIVPSMSAGDSINLYNKGANALLVYPPVGGVINGLSANAGYSVATATPFCEVYCIDALTYIASQSA